MAACERCGGHKPKKKKRGTIRGMRSHQMDFDEDDMTANAEPALEHPDQLSASMYHDGDEDDDEDERQSSRNSNVLEHPRMF